MRRHALRTLARATSRQSGGNAGAGGRHTAYRAAAAAALSSIVAR